MTGLKNDLASSPPPRRINLILSAILSGILLAALAGFAWKGLYTRYLQDDYCYGAEVVQRGFLPAQVNSYLNPMPYNSNRYSLTFFSGIVELLGGPSFSPYLLLLVILGWAAALYNTFSQWQKFTESRWPPWIPWTVTLALLFSWLHLAPDQYQVLFWRSAMLPYLAPAALGTFLFGRVLSLAQRTSPRLVQLVLLFLLGFLAGGFSEAAAAWLFTLCGLWIILAIFNRGTWRKLLQPLAWAEAGFTLALLVLALCPANAQRIESLGMHRPDFLTLLIKSLGFGFIYARYALRIRLVDFATVILTGFWLGWQAPPGLRWTLRKAIAWVAILGLSCYLLIVANTLPSLFTMSSTPDNRALFPAQVGLVASLFVAGWLAASYLLPIRSTRMSGSLSKPLTFVIGLGLCLYLLSSLPGVYSNLSAFQGRAHYWDLRQELIHAAVERGEQDLLVPEFNSISQVAELRPDPGFWVNTCAARYYQVHTLTAIEGTLDFPADFK